MMIAMRIFGGAALRLTDFGSAWPLVSVGQRRKHTPHPHHRCKGRIHGKTPIYYRKITRTTAERSHRPFPFYLRADRPVPSATAIHGIAGKNDGA